MSFEAVRQIIESRIFSESYTTVLGDSLTSISEDFNKTEAEVTRFNPSVDFTSGTEILFSTNSNNKFGSSRITGFTSEYLGSVGAVANTLLFFGGFGNDALAGNVNIIGNGQVQLYATKEATAGSLEDKVTNWVDIINGESTLGFTSLITSNGLGITLIPKSGVSNILTSGLTTVINPDTFGITLKSTITVGTVLNLGSTIPFPIFLESRNFTQPTADNANWAVLFINDAAVVGREFGNPRDGVRRSGSVRIALYAPRNNGTKLIRDMAAEFDRILSYTVGDSNTGNGGTFFVKAGSLTRVSDDDDGKLSYNLDYIYDYYTST